MKKLLIILCISSITARAADTTFVAKRISPVPTATNKTADILLDLNGTWFFNPSPELNFEKKMAVDDSWKKIEVPGEWVMQGFKVEKNQWAGYARTFTVPIGWKDKRIKLRCDGVYSESEIYVNGKKAGGHLGGFTPFEFDITGFIKPGTAAVIQMRVKNESLADSLASGSQYAVHALGGITRKIYLMAVPEVNISMFHVITNFDSSFKNSSLTTEIQLANETNVDMKSASLLFELFSPKGNKTVLSKEIAVQEIIKGNNTLDKSFEFPIASPEKWDPEHPNLYRYRLTLKTGNGSEILERKIGFRKIDVRGNRIFVNNMPVKLRGACRHEISPLRGRSLIGNAWVEDVQLFREENVNYIRTSHYPPTEEFVRACDSLGMFLEVEAPFCWADQTKVPDNRYDEAILAQTADMVNFFRSNVSIIDWSIANESQGAYKSYFKRSAALVKKMDATRPRAYNQYGEEVDDKELELSNFHYPGPEGPAKYRNNERPVVFNEYAHLNAYNRLELVTDPGLRDAWGIGFRNMWEKMYATPAIAGGCIWAGIDDTFILPGGTVVGYGTWGPIDDWRRKKPEYWHVKKTYSPVKIQLTGNYSHDSLGLVIENRLLFSNISECKINWRAGRYDGIIQPSIMPGQKQTISLKIPGNISVTDTLFIDVVDPRNILVDQYAFEPVSAIHEQEHQPTSTGGQIVYKKTERTVTASTGTTKITLDKSSGRISVAKGASKAVVQLGELMILPLNGEGRGTQMTGEAQVFDPFTNACANRVIRKVEYTCTALVFKISVHDEYDEASGYTTYEFSKDKKILVRYRYAVNGDINPRQWGMVASLPDDFNSISWRRNGLWNYYPSDHIGRLNGTATAVSSAPVSGAAGPVQKPGWRWSDDRTELGTNDFRSTKMYITEGEVQGVNAAVKIKGDGSQSIRTWKENGRTKLLVAAYSNLGKERFFRDHAEKFDRPLKQGDIIESTIELEME